MEHILTEPEWQINKTKWFLGYLETGDALHMMMIRASRNEEWGAPTKTGASSLEACWPFTVMKNPEMIKYSVMRSSFGLFPLQIYPIGRNVY